MNKKTLLTLLIGFALLAACASPATTPTQPVLATQTPLFIPTATLFPLTLTPGVITPAATLSGSQTPLAGTSNICTDPQVVALIDSLKSAILTSDGPLLSSLVSPTRDMDVAFFHDGTVITYDQEHTKFLFETTFEVNWGPEPGSGADRLGSFHDVVVPELVEIFNQPYTLHCNELKHGGASYEVSWPYEGNFYSVYYAGTEDNGFLDWHTWVVGIEYVNGKPYIYALMQFFWEP
jgi:hypothetical protein